MHYSNYKSKEMILRDHLAYDRTILALERTVLAYLRTAISLLAAGLTLILLYPDYTVSVFSGVILLVGGAVAGIYGAVRGRVMYRRLVQIYSDRELIEE